MKNLSTRIALPLGIATLLLAAAPLRAAGVDSQELYRQRVLIGVPIALAAPHADGVQVVPGSYARYLIHNGRPFDQAIADARAAGEQPVQREAVRETPRRLSGFEAHERYLGRSAAADVQADVSLAGHPSAVVR